MSAPLILYSTNTWLAYKIAERFYGDMHYVWCAPFFDSESLPRNFFNVIEWKWR